MPERRLFTDFKLCIGCHSCEIACKQENDLPVGVNRIRIVEAASRPDEALRLSFAAVVCKQCTRAPCIEACPVNALSRGEHEVVTLQKELCIGCKACIEACPFAGIDFDSGKGVIEKCDLCLSRINHGRRPFCEQNCPTGALFFGTPEEYLQVKLQELAQTVARRGQ